MFSIIKVRIFHELARRNPLPILTGETLTLIALFRLYMRLLDSISILNSRQVIRIGKHVKAKSLHCRGIEWIVGVSDHPFLINQY
mgnify:CR=1 FL=1